MLEDIKVLLNIDITDITKDRILNIYTDRAIVVIKNYLNNEEYTREYIQANFTEAIESLVEKAYNKKGKQHIKSETQGKRSTTYVDNQPFAITEDIVNLLPMPFIKMR